METQGKAQTGVEGLDDILAGGLQRGRVYLIEGSPGTGKTTIATQFLLAGAAAGERGLYITLSETEEELRESAASHGWTFDDPIGVYELVPPESLLDEDQQQSLLYSSDLELGETTSKSSRQSRRRIRGGSWSTAYRRSGCSRKARCAIGARCWH